MLINKRILENQIQHVLTFKSDVYEVNQIKEASISFSAVSICPSIAAINCHPKIT